MSQTERDIESLYRTFHDRLHAFLANRVSDPAIAEDIMQDVFVRIHDRIDTLRDETRIESWIFQIARNAVVDYYRSKGRSETLEKPADIASDEDEESASARLTPAVREFVDQLPEPYREALKAVEYDGVSQKELAERLGISFSGAKSRVQRARSMLRDLLMRCCHFELDLYGKVIDYHPISCCCCSHHPPGARQTR